MRVQRNTLEIHAIKFEVLGSTVFYLSTTYSIGRKLQSKRQQNYSIFEFIQENPSVWPAAAITLL